MTAIARSTCSTPTRWRATACASTPRKAARRSWGSTDKEYTFQPGQTIIADANGPESIAGVMGGLHSGCTEDTVNVFIEAAYFDPIRTAYTGRALKINSDARYRFERGIDPAWTPNGLEAATPSDPRRRRRRGLRGCGGRVDPRHRARL